MYTNLKRSLKMNSLGCDTQDPEYIFIFRSDVSNQNIFEKNARITTVMKISKIIENEFLNEINDKKTEIYKIFQNLHKACKMLHYLRFSIVTDFYNQKHICNNDIQMLKQSRLHYTVTSFTSRKIKDINSRDNCIKELDSNIKRKRKYIDKEYDNSKTKCSVNVSESITPKSIYKVTKRIIVGNISKWISPDLRNGNASHKWTIYIRDCHKSDIGKFISKVRFFLHPSYQPNDVVELTSAPFHLSRHGWGEFPVRVQLHFINSFNKPVDIIHYLKLDRTFTGLQTIGSETVVDLKINMKELCIMSDLKESINQSVNLINKSNLSENNNFHNDHSYIAKNTKFNEETYYLQKSKAFTNSPFCVTKNNIFPLEKNLIFNVNINDNKTSIKNENFEIFQKTKQLLIKKYNTSEFNVPNSLTNNKCKTIYNVINLENDCSIMNKKIDFKYNYFTNNENDFKSLVNVIDCIKPNTLFNIMKFIIRKVPLITTKSSESYYKMLYPYTTESYHHFYSYSDGKQRSLERYRAISVLNVIRCTKYFNGICTTNEIIKWARKYCYTPFFNLKGTHKMSISNKSMNIEDETSIYKYTSTISDHLNTWILQCQKINPNFINFHSENNEQIDILNIPLNIPDSLSKYNDSFKEQKNTSFLIEYPKTDDILNQFVSNSLQKIGIKLMNEEIVPGVIHHTANILITKVIEYLVDDIIRLAFSCTLDKTKSKKKNIFIEVDDVRMALLKKEEFEIFTNAGLGSED